MPNNATDFTPPDAYALPLKTAKSASTPADRYAAQRRAELDAEYAAADAADALRAARQPEQRLTAVELAAYAPPDTYQITPDKLKEQGR